MSDHYKTLSAVYPIIINEKGQVLLARRQNTGYMDGKWDLAGSGHVEADETATQAAIREVKEEVGISVDAAHVKFTHLTHRIGKNGYRPYYDLYFWIDAFSGEPIIAEPEKCSDLKWFDFAALPEDLIKYRRIALKNCLINNHYSELLVE